jgi:hypothetical protein
LQPWLERFDGAVEASYSLKSYCGEQRVY